MSHIILQCPITHAIKKVPTGFSWTMLFFGTLVPIIRGDIITSILFGMLTASIFIMPELIFLVMITQLCGAIVYNEMYLQGLKDRGWVPCKYANPTV